MSSHHHTDFQRQASKLHSYVDVTGEILLFFSDLEIVHPFLLLMQRHMVLCPQAKMWQVTRQEGHTVGLLKGWQI